MQGWSHEEFSSLSKQERARWLAFYALKPDVESYMQNEKKLKDLNIDLEGWIESDRETKDMHLKLKTDG